VSGKEDQVRRMLDGAHPPVPPGLALRAAARGARMAQRRRVIRRIAVLTLLAAVALLLAWLAIADPWAAPPAVIAPPPQLF
jgi:ferric-dicitrate binding protein FerR (iron transport regulator)